MKSSADINLSSRRELLLVAAGGLALAAAPARAVEKLQNIESRSNDIEAPMASAVSYIERHVLHDGHMIYTREYPGTYTFKQQVGDLSAVVDALNIDKFVPVGHDSGGPCAVNYAIDNPHRVAWLCLMNCYYAESPTLRLPEIIEVFGDPWLKDLAQAFLANPDKMDWLLRFQDQHFMAKMPDNLKKRFVGILRPIIDGNFANGAGPAFAQMTAQVRDSVVYNTARLPDIHKFQPNVSLIWGLLYQSPDALTHLSIPTSGAL